MHDLGLETIRLPLSTPKTEPHVPILASKNLATARRVVVVFGEPVQDLGIWAYRSVGSDSIRQGSAVALAEDIKNKNDATSDKSGGTALVLANTGQLIWHCRSRRAVTNATWLAMPRDSAVEGPPAMSHRNKIPRNENWQEHVACVFDDVLAPRGGLLREDAKIDIIGVSEGGLAAMQYLESDCECFLFAVIPVPRSLPLLLAQYESTNHSGLGESWKHRISAICLANPLHFEGLDISDDSGESDEDGDHSFADFIASRARAYVQSGEPVDSPVPGSREFGCNCYSSSEALYIECIVPRAWKEMSGWLEKMHANPEYAEPRSVSIDVDE